MIFWLFRPPFPVMLTKRLLLLLLSCCLPLKLLWVFIFKTCASRVQNWFILCSLVIILLWGKFFYRVFGQSASACLVTQFMLAPPTEVLTSCENNNYDSFFSFIFYHEFCRKELSGVRGLVFLLAEDCAAFLLHQVKSFFEFGYDFVTFVFCSCFSFKTKTPRHKAQWYSSRFILYSSHHSNSSLSGWLSTNWGPPIAGYAARAASQQPHPTIGRLSLIDAC